MRAGLLIFTKVLVFRLFAAAHFDARPPTSFRSAPALVARTVFVRVRVGFGFGFGLRFPRTGSCRNFVAFVYRYASASVRSKSASYANASRRAFFLCTNWIRFDAGPWARSVTIVESFVGIWTLILSRLGSSVGRRPLTTIVGSSSAIVSVPIIAMMTMPPQFGRSIVSAVVVENAKIATYASVVVRSNEAFFATASRSASNGALWSRIRTSRLAAGAFLVLFVTTAVDSFH